ncbi:MAG: CDP-alcohol phosphatidyltransferase family protein [Planctomycetota bacterium]
MPDITPRWLRLIPPTALTLTNLACGVAASVEAARLIANPADDGALTRCLIWFVIGLAADACDGALARKLDAATTLGRWLDAAADAVTSGIAPAMLALAALGANAPGSVVALAFALAAVTRLARFAADPTPRGRHFTGMPAPLAALGLVAVSAWHLANPTSIDPIAAIAWYAVAAHAALLATAMQSTLRYRTLGTIAADIQNRDPRTARTLAFNAIITPILVAAWGGLGIALWTLAYAAAPLLPKLTGRACRHALHPADATDLPYAGYDA